MNPELFDEDVCEDICGGTEDDDYNALEDEACCGDQVPSTPGTSTDQPAHLPSIVLDGANAIGGAIVGALRKPLPDFQNERDVTNQLRSLGEGARINALPKPKPDFKNEVHKERQNLGQGILEGMQKTGAVDKDLQSLGQGILEGIQKTGAVDKDARSLKQQKADIIEQMMREAGNSSESILRKLQEGNGENTNRTDAQKEAQQMMMEALRTLGIIPRPTPHNFPTPGSTESRPTTPSEKHRR